MRNTPGLIIATALITIGLSSRGVRAETAVNVESCAQVEAGLSAYRLCVLKTVRFGGSASCRLPASTQCWDFEAGLAGGASGGWTVATLTNIGLLWGFLEYPVLGPAFDNQPTYGDNVNARRALKGVPSPVSANASVLGDIDSVGGDYWQTPYPIGHEGNHWLGTSEQRPRESDAWGGLQGEAPVGTLLSPQFVVDRDYITFLIGGGAVPYIELQLLVPLVPEYWVPAVPGYWRFQLGGIECPPGAGGGGPPTPGPGGCTTTNSGQVWVPEVPGYMAAAIPAHWSPAPGLKASGSNSDLMERKFFRTDPTTGLQGKTVRLVIVDNSYISWGHINVDHVLHTNNAPNDLGGRNRPLWGFADTHAHPGNHLSFSSLGNTTGPGGVASEGHLLHGDPALPPTACPAGNNGGVSGHGSPHQGSDLFLKLLEGMSFGGATDAKGQTSAIQFHNTAALSGWPHWFTRTHQQMQLTQIERAYKGGQRLMVAAAGNHELVGAFLRDSRAGKYLSDYGAMRQFAVYMTALAKNNSKWMEIALTPAQARRIIGQNKLAIVLATEVEDIGDHCASDMVKEDDKSGVVSTYYNYDVWWQDKDRAAAASCAKDDEWRTRVDNLYAVGYRLITPIHHSTQALGGNAIYNDLFNAANRFLTGKFYEAEYSQDVSRSLEQNTFGFVWCTNLGCLNPNVSNIDPGVAFWLHPIFVIATAGQNTPAKVPLFATSIPKRDPTQGGHINSVGLLGPGETVLEQMMSHGMLIDVAHMGQKARHKVLGIDAANRTTSIINPGCDMDLASCQEAAYPVIATHAGLREMERDGLGDENGLSKAMIDRIWEIGGMIGVGTSPVDSRSTDEATGGATDPATNLPWAGVFAQNVGNTCAGSSKTWAQEYVYALRRMKGRPSSLGTDINGLEAQLNSRFGTLGCYARGTIPFLLKYAFDQSTIVNTYGSAPINYDPKNNPDHSVRLLEGLTGKNPGTAGAQRKGEHDNASGLNYAHYAGAAPNTNPSKVWALQYQGLWDPAGYIPYVIAGAYYPFPGSYVHNSQTLTWGSMKSLDTGSSPLNASVSENGLRTFDFNYDGLSHYGMLPDLLQDAKASGVTVEQLAPLFQSAEQFVKVWEKSCAKSDPAVSGPGCAP